MDPTALVPHLRTAFGVDVVDVEPVGHGADTRADLHQVRAVDGSEYAAKTSTGPQPGLAVADLVASRGVSGVPRPLRTVAGDLTAPCGAPGSGLRLSLVPWVRGHRVLDTGMASGGWTSLGRLLGHLHTTPVDSPALAAVPTEAHDPTAVVARTRDLADLVGRAIASHPDDAVIAEVARSWPVEGPRVLAVADRAEHRADPAAQATAPPVLCHGDPHHGNLVVDQSGRVHLIDWDDAVVAPREADLMFVVGGVFSHATITDEQVRLFFDGYTPVTGTGLSDLDRDQLTYLRSVRALVDLADLFRVALSPAEHDQASRREALRYARSTLGPGGLVDLALT